MKTLKSLSFIVCLILCSLTYKSFSQDVITLSNGTEIEAKVIKITDSEIEYKKWNNQEGPSYVEKVSNVSSIKYQNGNKDTFNQKTAEVKVVNEKKKSKPKPPKPKKRSTPLKQYLFSSILPYNHQNLYFYHLNPFFLITFEFENHSYLLMEVKYNQLWKDTIF